MRDFALRLRFWTARRAASLVGVVHAFGGDKRGLAALEFAIVSPVMLAFMFGVIDAGRLYRARMRINYAAEATALYAIKNLQYTSATLSGVAKQTTNDALASIPSAPEVFYGCPSSSGIITAKQGDICASTLAASSRYLRLSVNSPFTPIFPIQGVSAAQTLVASATIRIP
jgi:Flp pilus assembly protein TadG